MHHFHSSLAITPTAAEASEQQNSILCSPYCKMSSWNANYQIHACVYKFISPSNKNLQTKWSEKSNYNIDIEYNPNRHLPI